MSRWSFTPIYNIDMSYTSILSVYADIPEALTPGRNAIIEDFGFFYQQVLIHGRIYVDDHFQWVRPAITQNIKVPLSQEVVAINAPRYVSIYEEGKRYLYFVVGVEQTAPETINLSLRMDVLNTFALGTDYEFGKHSHITRKSKDRFTIGGNYFAPLIDRYDEGINVPFIRTRDVKLSQGTDDLQYSLVYRPDPAAENALIRCELHPFHGDYSTTAGSGANFKELDTADFYSAAITKIIVAPYAPFTPIWSGNTFVSPNPVSSGFTYDSGVRGYTASPNNGTFVNVVSSENYITETAPLPWTDTGMLFPGLVFDAAEVTSRKYVERFVKDSKLYHSSFYISKLVFDSFAMQIKLENLVISSGTLNWGFETKFIMTHTINSKFLFRIETTTPGWRYIADEDFPLTLLASRNSEQTIYSSDYLNYLKTGYNYDKKVASQNMHTSFVTSAVQLGGALGSALIGAATANPISIAAGISLGVTGVTSTISNIKNTIQANESIEQKKRELLNQSVSVSGTDDLDLFQYYGDNKLHYMAYRPTAEYRTMLNNLFYLYGYACNDYGVPDYNTRLWFDVLMGDMELLPIGNGYPTAPALEELRTKYAEGVTIYHHNPEASATESEQWDFEQKMENWERKFFL